MIEYGTHFKNVKKEFKELIELRKKSSSRDEKAVQEFIEKNPFCILSALGGIDANYAFLGNVVISQPQLKSADGDRAPDFLIVSRNSLNLYFNFIELEDPSKKVFKATEQCPSSDFMQAYNQLKQWSSFSKNEVQNYCAELLRTLFKDNFNNTPEKKIHYNHILVYGFSDEITKLGERYNNLLQEYFNESNLKHCTYSRMINELRFNQPFFTVKKDVKSNKFKAIGCTPFRSYKIDEWSEFHNIIDKEVVINESEYFTEDEKKKLINEISELDNKTVKEIIDININSPGITITNFGDLDI
ncbi:Shedu anti-phage system protein SduA domain-containing protein [Allomuricauda sp. d1]|uniref:Shedu anti-phage system protein SduA domain-containing protein n=1 Tax=Allomuricauda sp. d1 TaxID=3136725 RepID=UPI0031E342BC